MGSKTKSWSVLLPLSLMILSLARVWQSLPGLGIMKSALNNMTGATSVVGSQYVCDHNFSIEILSIDPLIIYLNNFLKDEEINHLLQHSKGRFRASPVYNENLETVIDTEYRTSSSAMMPANDTVSMCLSQRLKSMLGNVQHQDTEPIQVVRYEQTERFRYHMDWFDQPRTLSLDPPEERPPHNRLASIFAYLEDDCQGGETFFPLVTGVPSTADGTKFSRTESGKGLLVRPRRGNAVFWNNLLPNGTGDLRLTHAGLPVHKGVKVGINLFSNYYYGSPMVGGD